MYLTHYCLTHDCHRFSLAIYVHFVTPQFLFDEKSCPRSVSTDEILKFQMRNIYKTIRRIIDRTSILKKSMNRQFLNIIFVSSVEKFSIKAGRNKVS